MEARESSDFGISLDSGWKFPTESEMTSPTAIGGESQAGLWKVDFEDWRLFVMVPWETGLNLFGGDMDKPFYYSVSMLCCILFK